RLSLLSNSSPGHRALLSFPTRRSSDLGLLARARSPRGLLPERVRGPAVVVPRRARRDPSLASRGDRVRGPVPHLGVHRRHARLLLDPRAPRHVAPARRGLPRGARRGAPPRPRRGARGRRRPRRGAPAGGVRAVRLRRTSPAPPVRHVHLGLGSFFRAHQAWYTHRASDADAWGIAAFSGRSAELARTLAAQDGLFTLDVRGPDGDELEVVTSLVRTHGADD